MDSEDQYKHKKFGRILTTKQQQQEVAPEECDDDCIFVKEYREEPSRLPLTCNLSSSLQQSTLLLGGSKLNNNSNCRAIQSNNIINYPIINTKSDKCMPSSYSTLVYYPIQNTSANLVVERRNNNSEILCKNINDETDRSNLHLNDLLKFHSNMVRTFKTKSRSVKEQMRRNQNTILCRIYRRRKKIEQFEMKRETERLKERYLEITRGRIRCYQYVQQLLKLIRMKLLLSRSCKNNFIINRNNLQCS